MPCNTPLWRLLVSDFWQTKMQQSGIWNCKKLHMCTWRPTAGRISAQTKKGTEQRTNWSNYQQQSNHVYPREAPICDAVSSDTLLLLGGSETLCLLLLHLFSALCARGLNWRFPSGKTGTLPSHPCLCLSLTESPSPAPSPCFRVGLFPGSV